MITTPYQSVWHFLNFFFTFAPLQFTNFVRPRKLFSDFAAMFSLIAFLSNSACDGFKLLPQMTEIEVLKEVYTLLLFNKL